MHVQTTKTEIKEVKVRYSVGDALYYFKTSEPEQVMERCGLKVLHFEYRREMERLFGMSGRMVLASIKAEYYIVTVDIVPHELPYFIEII